ncbi:quinon protein alcohol dehydrogenase-like superfamily [Coniochaeta sp. 2T2.1]|nr:quinon protein alcohol dehydrogenase-like superfamily [Coniochaeta sp. 2T2.1]
MAPTRDRNGDSDRATKRKRDKAETEEERRNRKKQKSKRKSLPEQNGHKDDDAVPAQQSPEPEAVKDPASLQLVRQDGTNGQLEAVRHSAAWNVSKPIGGRMLDIDPAFSADELHLILTYNTSIQVYTTADSLLVRRITIPLSTETGHGSKGQHIVSSVLSKDSPNNLWVATSDGRVFCIDWTTGSGADAPYQLTTILDMTVDSVQVGKTTEDVLLVLEKTGISGGRVRAYNRESLKTGAGILLYNCSEFPHLIRSANNASVVIVAGKDSIHVGSRTSKAVKSPADLEYGFFAFTVEHTITTVDVRCLVRPTKKQASSIQPVDLAVGCAHGKIFLYYDVVARSPVAGPATPRKGTALQPVKKHWHRRAVHSVKWSHDGNYLISGGAEEVLVLWQLDTGKTDYLPHLGATIENIVVSPRGSSYAVHLDDNSTMVLSTSEMKPTTYVSGVQSVVLSDTKSKEMLVHRVSEVPEEIARSVPAASNPTNSSQITLAVGNGQQSMLADGNSLSAPYVQIFDVESSQSVSKQAMARTNPTEANITSEGHPIVEPMLTQVTYSHDGTWLATVDEWQPPERDVNALIDGSRSLADLCRERREIYLKFWEVDEETGNLQLVTRINEAHRTVQTEPIFDLATNPTTTQFATIGGDGVVRVWSPRLRQRDGLAATGPEGHALWSWYCSQMIHLGENVVPEDDVIGLQAKADMAGAIDYSEDGSILFAAYGAASNAVVYIIDTESGEIRDRINGMFTGEIRSLKAIASCLVMLSNELTVYDIVADELRYGLNLSDRFNESTKLTQLAVNRRSRTFALAVPLLAPEQKKATKGTASELAIFSIEENTPQLVQHFPHLITAVLPAAKSSGFIIVDSAAQIWSANEGAEAVTLAKPLEDLQLDRETSPMEEGMDLAIDVEEDEEYADEEMEDADAQDTDDYDIHQAVVPPQALADIFNAGPSFAMPPIEDLFYQVAGLYSAKPLETPSA